MSQAKFDVYTMISARKVFLITLTPILIALPLLDYLPRILIEGGGVLFLVLMVGSSLYLYSKRELMGKVVVASDQVSIELDNTRYAINKDELNNLTLFRSTGMGSVSRSNVKLEYKGPDNKHFTLTASQTDLEGLYKEIKKRLNHSVKISIMNGCKFIAHLLKH